MNTLEKDYLSEVRRVLSDTKGHKATAVALMAIKASHDTKGFSINSLELMKVIDYLDFAYKDGELELTEADVYDLEDTNMDKVERELVEQTINTAENILKDIDDENWYQYNYYIRSAYSKVEGGDYIYKVIDKRLGTITADEAAQIKAEMAAKAPKKHPDDPSYTLEHINLGMDIDDSKGKRIVSQIGSPID